MKPSSDSSLSRFRAPRYWLTWIVLGVMHLSARLTPSLQVRVGSGLGWLFRTLQRREVRIARRNLQICLPELSDDDRNDLVRRHFRSIGMSVVEMGIGWFTPIERLRERVEIRGLEHLDAALALGNGALLVTAHFTPIEVGVCVLEDTPFTINSLYRPQRNAMMDELILRGRSRFASQQI